MNIRRRVLFALGASALTAPFGSFAQQQGKVWRIGFLGVSTQADLAPFLDVFRQALREFGYFEGKDYVLELRFAGGQLDRL